MSKILAYVPKRELIFPIDIIRNLIFECEVMYMEVYPLSKESFEEFVNSKTYFPIFTYMKQATVVGYNKDEFFILDRGTSTVTSSEAIVLSSVVELFTANSYFLKCGINFTGLVPDKDSVDLDKAKEERRFNDLERNRKDREEKELFDTVSEILKWDKAPEALRGDTPVIDEKESKEELKEKIKEKVTELSKEEKKKEVRPKTRQKVEEEEVGKRRVWVKRPKVRYDPDPFDLELGEDEVYEEQL